MIYRESECSTTSSKSGVAVSGGGVTLKSSVETPRKVSRFQGNNKSIYWLVFTPPVHPKLTDDRSNLIGLRYGYV